MWALSLLVMTIYVRSLHAPQCSALKHSRGWVIELLMVAKQTLLPNRLLC